MEYQDRTLVCVECHQELVFTAGEQLFFHDKKFKNEPRRCKTCKAKQRPPASGDTSPVRVETEVTCSQCGRQTLVPFRPTQGRPVYCRECFQERRGDLSAKAGSV